MRRKGWDDQMKGTRTFWRRKRRMGRDDQMRGHKTIDQVYVRSQAVDG